MKAPRLGVVGLGLAFLLCRPAPAAGAPVGKGVMVVVLGLESEDAHDVAAQTLTNELRQVVVESSEHTLSLSNPALIFAAGGVKCDLGPFARRYGPDSDRGIDGGCERSMATRLGAKQMLWGHLYEAGGALRVKVHYFREGTPDRIETLAYDASAPKRVARRLYLKLTAPEAVGDVRVTGDESLGSAELFVDGKAEGPFAPGLDLTLPPGDHAIEARREGKALARAKARVTARQAVDVRLEAVEAVRSNVNPFEGFRNPPPIDTTPRGAWKRPAGFVALGVGAAGVLGAGAFFALRRGEESDLDDLCRGRAGCPAEAREALDRSNRWATLSLVSFGIGAAGVGVGAFLLLTAPRSNAAASTVRLGAVPVAGGALTTLTLRTF